MFTDRRARSGLAKVHTVLHVLLACISLPLAAPNDHSVRAIDHPGSAKRVPSMSFTMIEERPHGIPPSGANAASYRRSLYRPVNMDYTNYRRSNVNGNTNRNKNYNRIVKTQYRYNHSRSGNQPAKVTTYRDEIPNENQMTVDNGPIVNKLEVKLYSCVRFRTSIIMVFGQILKAPNNKLNIDQFTSLNIILQALIHKQVYMFNILPVLKKLQDTDKQTQFKLIMHALTNNVPIYISGACKFWMKELENRNVDINEITASIKEPANFLTGLDPQTIDRCKIKIAADEKQPFDEASELTKKTLGLVYVNIFHKMKNHEIMLSQKLFGSILINLPIGKLNPVLEEYINYIWDVMQGNSLSNWYDIASQIEYGNPYEIVTFVMKKLLIKKDTPNTLKRTLRYILLHLKEVPVTYSDEYYSDMQMLVNDARHVMLLVSMIQDDVTIPELGELRDRLIKSIKHVNINAIFEGMNMYIYQKPMDMLIALLVRLQNRVENTAFRVNVSKLLSILVSKNTLDSYAVTVNVNVDLVSLLEFLIVPDGDPGISTLVQKVQQNLEENSDLLIILQDLLLKQSKGRCRRPIQCVVNLFGKIIKPDVGTQLRIPTNFIKMARELVILIKNTITNSVKCEAHDLMSFERPEIMDDSKPDIFQTTTETIEFTRPPLPETSKAVKKPMPPVIPDDNENTTFKPQYPKSTTPESGEILFPDDPIFETTPATSSTTLRTTFKPQTTVEIITKPLIITTTTKRPLLVTSTNPITTEEPPVNPESNTPPQEDLPPVLPPNLSLDRPIFIVFPEDDTPPYIPGTKPDGDPSDSETVEFPPVKDLLQELKPDTPFEPEELPVMPNISEPLKQIFGLQYVHKILGKIVNKVEYPTVVSLITDLLLHAIENENVKANNKLVLTIKRYLKGIDYITAIALLPVVVDSKKITSDLLFVTFDPDNPNANRIDPEQPKRIPANFLTLPIYHPKFWVQKVDPLNPYGTLLPSFDEGEDNPIQALLNDGSLQDILGPNFDPMLYPNRGILLTIILQKLVASDPVKNDVVLQNKLTAYLKSIRVVALYTKVPKDYYIKIIGLQQNDKVHWQPDTETLIIALPPATSQNELNKINLIKYFLTTPNLLQMLEIPNLSFTTTRGALLKMIFDAAIRGNKITLDAKTLAALKYYESKILLKGHGLLPIVWIWVQLFIIREEVALGDIIEAVIDYDSLSYELKLAYNELMTYLAENPQFLQGNNDFAFENYDTKGTFLKGLFTYFLSKPKVSQTSKKHLKQLIPHIKLDGRGLEKMNHVTIENVGNDNVDKAGFSVLMHG